MNGTTLRDGAPAPEFYDRVSAETLLGFDYKPRIYSSSGRTENGTVTVSSYGGKIAMNAYIIDGGCYAQGVLVNRDDRRPSLLLTPRGRKYTQSELAEAVEFWERGRDNLIYCLYEKSCGAIVFTEVGGERRYLMICMNLGHCGLPKGHVEKFETEREAAVREILEETGVNATLLDGFRETVEYPISAKTRKESVYFIGYFNGGDVKIQESEISAYKLCPYEEARKYITHDNDRTIFENAVKWLEANYNA